MSEFIVKQLYSKDWELLRNMRIKAVSEFPDYFLDNVQSCTSYNKSYWINILSDINAIFGLFDNNNIVGITGCFRWKQSPDDTLVFGLSYLDREYRGQKLSKYFYDARINWAINQPGIKYILAAHREGNDASRAAILKAGFKLKDCCKKFYGDGKEALSYNYIYKLKSH